MNRRRRNMQRYGNASTMRLLVLAARLSLYEAVVDESMFHARASLTPEGKRENVKNAREFNRLAVHTGRAMRRLEHAMLRAGFHSPEQRVVNGTDPRD